MRLKVTITFFIKNCEMYIQNPKKKIDIVKRKLTVLREKDRGKLIHFEGFFFIFDVKKMYTFNIKI